MDALRQPSLIFKIANILTGALLVAGAVGHFIYHSFSSIVIGIYALAFGAVLIGLEVYQPPTNYVTLLYQYASFLFSFAGRGVFYILAGVLLLNHYVLLYVSGGFVIVFGIGFIALEAIKMFDVPPSMVAPIPDHDSESHPVWTPNADSA